MAEEQIVNYLGKYRLSIDPTFTMDQRILSHGAWEIHVIEFIDIFVKPGDICIDVGANAGYHTLLMADKVGPTGHVYAFEPNNIVYPKLLKNMKLNPELEQVVQCVNLALSKNEGELKVFQTGADLGNAYVSTEYNKNFWNMNEESHFQICKVIRLDDYEMPGPVSFMKIDVEGMELDVLMGAEKLLLRDHPTIIYETLMDCFDQAIIKQSADFLVAHGYLLFRTNLRIGKLVPTAFPQFQEDTVAIHRSKIPHTADIMSSAARYSSEKDNCLGITSIFLISDSDLLFYVKMVLKNGEAVAWYSVPFDGSALSLNLTQNNREMIGLEKIDDFQIEFTDRGGSAIGVRSTNRARLGMVMPRTGGGVFLE